MKERPKNVAASVSARLLDGAKDRQEDFNLTLQRYAAERFLYRLGASEHRKEFVLKGAMLFALWGGSLYRATRDLDLTGYTDDDVKKLVPIIQRICAVPCPEDGLAFLRDTVHAEPIRDESEYHGYRVRLLATLDAARINLQIDIGFGNAIHPSAQDLDYPTLLDAPRPNIRAYPREASIAEKFHAMVVLGSINSRYKDFYDVYVLARHFDFAGADLARAIAATFERRRTAIPDAQPEALTSAFYADSKRAADWRRYLDRNDLPGAPRDFTVVGEVLQGFIVPAWNALRAKKPFKEHWRAGGPWVVVGLERETR